MSSPPARATSSGRRSRPGPTSAGTARARGPGPGPPPSRSGIPCQLHLLRSQPTGYRSVTDRQSVCTIDPVAVKSLRERQAEATRQLLVSVARELFAERGYADTSIEDIIQRAGVARGALYHHFPGKD